MIINDNLIVNLNWLCDSFKEVRSTSMPQVYLVDKQWYVNIDTWQYKEYHGGDWLDDAKDNLQPTRYFRKESPEGYTGI